MNDFHDLVPSAPEVQWVDYFEKSGGNFTVPNIRDFGVSATNNAYSLWVNRDPWWSGAPTQPVAGPNVQTMIQTPLHAAQEFYDSLP